MMQFPPRRTIPAAILLSLLSLASLPAQNVGGGIGELWLLEGDAANPNQLGMDLDLAGDLDGDGRDDWLLLEFGPTPQATIHSGQSPELVLWTSPPHPLFYAPTAVAGAGDLDGDGFQDWAVGYESWGLTVFFGPDATRFLEIPGVGGAQVWKAGDVDGDGRPDLVSSAVARYNRNFSGSDTIWLLSGFQPGGSFLSTTLTAAQLGVTTSGLGASFAALGTFTGTAAGDEFAIGALDLWTGFPSRFWVVGMVGGSLQATWQPAPNPPSGYVGAGQGLGPMPDLDGDGLRELAAQGETPNTMQVDIWTASSPGAPLTTVSSSDPSRTHFGAALASPGDLDGDGVADLLIGDPLAPGNATGVGISGGEVTAWSGASLASGSPVPLMEWYGDDRNANLGSVFSQPGDLNGDGRLEVVAGGPWGVTGVPVPGFARALGYAPWIAISSGTLSAAAGGDLAVQLDFPASEAGLDYHLFASSGTGPLVAGGIDLPLSYDSLFQTTLGLGAPFAGTLDSQGDAAFAITAAPGQLSAFVGQTLFFAAASGDAATATGRLSSGPMPLEILP